MDAGQLVDCCVREPAQGNESCQQRLSKFEGAALRGTRAQDEGEKFVVAEAGGSVTGQPFARTARRVDFADADAVARSRLPPVVARQLPPAARSARAAD